MKERPVLRVGVKLLIPFILLFALYVQFHGDFGPGGGFQAGVIFASAFIVYTLIYGVGAAKAALPAWVRRLLLCGGVLVYAGTGVVGLLLGKNYLDYSVLAHEPLHGQELGVGLVEFGVGMAVFAAMSTIFIIFADYTASSREDR